MSEYKYGIKNEANVCNQLQSKKLFSGLSLVPGSGSKFNKKEDLIGINTLIQVKSTRGKSYRLLPLDFKKLQANAAKRHKIPIFIVYFSGLNLMKILIPFKEFISTGEFVNSSIYSEYMHEGNCKIDSDVTRKSVKIDSESYVVLNKDDFT